MFKTIIPALALSAMIAPAFASENWTTNLPAALEQAAKEKKLVLVDFNGSDWCGPCISLKKNVFDKAEFLAYAKDKFILVDIDLPRKKIAPELLEANQALTEQYAITGFPSVFVMNSKGIVVGGFVGGNNSIPAVQAILDAAIVNAAKVQVALGKAVELSGVEQSKALYAVYQMVPAELQASNTKLMTEIKTGDKEDSLGFAKAAAAEVAIEAEFERVMSGFHGIIKDNQAVIELASKELANDKISDKLRSVLSSMKLNAMLISSKSIADIEAAKVFALSFAKAHPESEQVLPQVEAIFAEPEKLLERVTEARNQNEASQK